MRLFRLNLSPIEAPEQARPVHVPGANPPIPRRRPRSPYDTELDAASTSLPLLVYANDMRHAILLAESSHAGMEVFNANIEALPLILPD